TVRPLSRLVTSTIDPRGSSRCAAVSLDVSNVSPEAGGFPSKPSPPPYQEARPSSLQAGAGAPGGGAGGGGGGGGALWGRGGARRGGAGGTRGRGRGRRAARPRGERRRRAAPPWSHPDGCARGGLGAGERRIELFADEDLDLLGRAADELLRSRDRVELGAR